MSNSKFSLMQYTISQIISFIELEKFAIPEIQRPFVWKRSQVRDLIDSLFNGYPTGYIITWKNPDIKTKDGGVGIGKEVLIDGQQRVTALMAAITGKEVLNEDFEKIRIKIAYNPFAEDSSKRFAVQDASHLKNKKWIPDIAEIFRKDFDSFEFAQQYAMENPDISPKDINTAIVKLLNIQNRNIGVIELDQSLDIDEVTDIFIRINSKGTALSQSDFVMSKMASDTNHNGDMMRRAVDYFCHLAVKPEFYSTMIKDLDFQATEYAPRLKWLESDRDEIYDPDYGDMLRVAFMLKFHRGKLADLVSLLSGRDFKTKEFRDEIVEESYDKLNSGILKFINEYSFKQFVIAIKSAGYVSPKLLNSSMTLDFAYMLYLMLNEDSLIQKDQIKRLVQKWFVLTTLTQRYIGSPETKMDSDIRSIEQKGFVTFMQEIEASDLSDTFWNVTLPQNLETSSVNSPAFNTFIAAQINKGSRSLLMNGTSIADLINISGDVHHIFPRAYLKKNGVDSKTAYNQVANYTYLYTSVNKIISDYPPCTYFSWAEEQCATGIVKIGNILNIDDLMKNYSENCIPSDVSTMTVDNYNDFLNTRRHLMAKFIESYYKNL